MHVFDIFSKSIDTNARRLDKLVKNPFFDWSTALRNFNYHHCKYDVHIASLLLSMQIFVSVLENEINPISQTHNQLLENTVSKSREKSSIVNTSFSVECIVYHLEATYVTVAINILPNLKHYLILDVNLKTRYRNSTSILPYRMQPTVSKQFKIT